MPERPSGSSDTKERTDTRWHDDPRSAFPYRTGDRDRPRLGLSLVAAALCQVVITVVAIVTGATLVGLASTVAIAACGALLVGAEVSARRRRAADQDRERRH